MPTAIVEPATIAADSAPIPAGKSPRSHMIFWVTVFAFLALDLFSKAWVFENIGARESRTIIGGLLEFRRSLNDGAVFGSFSGRVGVFIVASMFALAFVLYLFLHSNAKQWVLHISLGMILSGALGNLYDRAYMIADVVRFHDGHRIIGKVVEERPEGTLRVGDWPDGGNIQRVERSEATVHQQGVVRDFIKFVPAFPKSFPKLGGNDIWPWVFNVADAALVVGVIVLMLTSIFERNPKASPSNVSPA